MIHSSIRLYLWIEVVDDGSEKKDRNFTPCTKLTRDTQCLPVTRIAWELFILLYSMSVLEKDPIKPKIKLSKDTVLFILTALHGKTE